MNFRVLGINSGLGVSLFPFKKYLVGNVEIRRVFHTPHDEQWRINFQNIPLYKKELPKISKLIDVVISSPDCGSGSILRYSRAKKLGDHLKNHSLLLFFKGIKKYNPKLFLFENLDGLFKSFPKEKFEELLGDYHLVKHTASVLHWGNSQVNRKRLVVVGIRKDLPYQMIAKYFKLPSKKEPKTCLQLYGDISRVVDFRLGQIREDLDSTISIYGGKRVTLRALMDEWLTRLKGKKRYFVPESEGRKFKTAPGVYRNTSDSFPATARKANRQFDHLGLTLTPRQLARVQGIPDDFKIFMDPEKPGYWINKSRTTVTKTPPYEISVWFKRKLEKCYHLWK